MYTVDEPCSSPAASDQPQLPRAVDGAPLNANAMVYPQVVINGVYKHARANEIEDLLKSKDLAFKKVKKVPKMDFAFVTFDSDGDMTRCVDALTGVVFRQNKLEVAVRTHVAERNRKRPLEPSASDEKRDEKRVKEGREAVSPWWRIPYEEQLNLKQANMKTDCLGKMATSIINSFKIQNVPKKFMPSWLFEDALGLQFNSIIRSPEVVGYRNKCEFTFGRNATGAPEVGFRVSSFDDGALIASPQDSPTVPNAMKIVARTLTEFITTSPLQTYNISAHSGVWRTVVLRYSKRTQQLMLMLVVCLHGDCSDTNATDADKIMHSTFDCEIQRLAAMLQALTRDSSTDDESIMYSMCNYVEVVTPDKHVVHSDESKGLVTGLCYQVFNGLSVPSSDLPYTRVFGQPTMDEILLDCNFQVSPQAFFQVNTRTAELLFSHVIDMIDADFTAPLAVQKADVIEISVDTTPSESLPIAEKAKRGDTVCLDVCCGTGTIGICVAAETCNTGAGSHIVLGVDLCAPAIDDAWKNAERNKVAPLINRVLLEGNDPTSADIVSSAAGSRGKAYFVSARAEALMEGILYRQGWRGCNGTITTGTNMLPLEEQRRLHAELTQLRTIVDGKRLLAIVDPPREVRLILLSFY